MLLDWFRSKFGTAEKAQPLAVHIFMVGGVILYALVGALIMRKLEMTVTLPSTVAEESVTVLTERRRCLKAAIKQLLPSFTDRWNATAAFDSCYGVETVVELEAPVLNVWAFSDSFLFCFTIITTIGYGNVAPKSFEGRLFCIFYGLVGIPFTMLAIADLGKFLAEMAGKMAVKIRRRIRGEKRRIGDEQQSNVVGADGKEKEELLDDLPTGIVAFILLAAFLTYMFIGAVMLPAYEADLTFFSAVYFNFVTLTTVGLGDIVPKSNDFLVFTLVYIAVGLALTTIAIEIASDYLKQLHYFGRKIHNVANIKIWFGGKPLTMKQLVNNIGDQFDIPVDDVLNLDLDQFVETAIDVEAGKICSIRQQREEARQNALNKPLLLEDVQAEAASVGFADDEPSDPGPESTRPLLPPSSPVSYRPLLTPPLARSPPLPPLQKASTLSVSTFQSGKMGNVDSASLRSTCHISPLDCVEEWSLGHIYVNEMPEPDYSTKVEVPLPSPISTPASSIPPSPVKTPRGLMPRLAAALKEVDSTEIGRRNVRHDPEKRYEMYRQEWERFKTAKESPRNSPRGRSGSKTISEKNA